MLSQVLHTQRASIDSGNRIDDENDRTSPHHNTVKDVRANSHKFTNPNIDIQI